jgi:hypothetical protein
MKHKTSVWITTLMLAVARFSLATTILAQNKEQSAQDPAKQLTAITTLMDSIRATNIFRKEDGQWKMIGHHVDLLPQMAK